LAPPTPRFPALAEHDKDPVDVISFGPDKKLGTDDDINSWQL